MLNSSFKLRDRNIHVWSVRLEASQVAIAQLEKTLADDELNRAARFRSDPLMCSFIAARGALRMLLGRYLSKPPATLQFDYGPNGKPSLGATSSVTFNASHAGGIAAFAITTACEVGIDIELIRSIPEMRDVARRFFCSAETEDWESLPEPERELGFYLCWTRRESYIKATGNSLADSLEELRVSLRPEALPCFIQVPHIAGRATEWSLHNLDLEPGYAAALAYPGVNRPVQIFPPTALEDLLNPL